MSNRIRFSLFVVVLLFGCSSLASKAIVIDAVMEWNQIALSSTVTAGQGPQPQARTMTIVQVSVNDAVNAITGRHDTYLSYGPPPAGASAEAAAIAAAHRSLVTLFPSQTTALDAARLASLASRGLTEANPGIAIGESAAAGILTLRAGDGAAQAQFPYSAPGAGSPGVWVPLTAVPALLPGLGNVTWSCTVLAVPPDGPPALTADVTRADYIEIKATDR